MTKVIISAEVEDASNWETGFRTHVALFQKQTVNSPIEFFTNDNNEVTICCEIEDIDTYMKAMDSQETADAMANDGVKRETVKIHVLDKRLEY